MISIDRPNAQKGTDNDEPGIQRPNNSALGRFNKPAAEALADLLGLSASSEDYERGSLKVDDVNLVIYRYEAAKRSPHTKAARARDRS
jgi:hypothetical protein